MNELELSGIDGQNPLGFLAALGTLRIVAAREPSVRLRFVDVGIVRPVLHTSMSLDEIVGEVLEDAARRVDDPVVSLAYDASGARTEPTASGATRDLKPPPALARDVLERAARAGGEAAALAAAVFSELVQANKGDTKPTALHFTAGQQQFLQMADDLRAAVSAVQLRGAICGPWESDARLPSLSWDSAGARMYALRATNPSDEKRGSVPGANWLAFCALPFFPVVARRGRLETTCIRGGWKDSRFTWPTWSPPAELSTIASLLRVRCAPLHDAARKALGISSVFSCRILRSDQGGYGSFSPAQVVLPGTCEDDV